MIPITRSHHVKSPLQSADFEHKNCSASYGLYKNELKKEKVRKKIDAKKRKKTTSEFVPFVSAILQRPLGP